MKEVSAPLRWEEQGGRNQVKKFGEEDPFPAPKARENVFLGTRKKKRSRYGEKGNEQALEQGTLANNTKGQDFIQKAMVNQ